MYNILLSAQFLETQYSESKTIPLWVGRAGDGISPSPCSLTNTKGLFALLFFPALAPFPLLVLGEAQEEQCLVPPKGGS